MMDDRRVGELSNGECESRAGDGDGGFRCRTERKTSGECVVM